ncbi:18494_t:CDS:2, partial [Acaulospora morrowiae]
ETTGDSLDARRFHTAVLSPNEGIVIYGGEDTDSRPVLPSLAILKTTTIPYNWYIPNSTDVPDLTVVPPLSRHSAIMYGNYMILAF